MIESESGKNLVLACQMFFERKTDSKNRSDGSHIQKYKKESNNLFEKKRFEFGHITMCHFWFTVQQINWRLNSDLIPAISSIEAKTAFLNYLANIF